MDDACAAKKADTSNLVPPHGGRLMPLLTAGGAKRDRLLHEAKGLRKIRPSSKELSDLFMLAMGAFSPLTGFMGEADYLSVLKNMRLTNGVLWPVSIALPVSGEEAGALKEGERVALVGADDAVVGILTIEDKYQYDKEQEALAVFGTADPKHPGVHRLLQQGDFYLGGSVTALSEGAYPEQFGEFYARPAEVRSMFVQKGWSTVAAFQTRNPLHRSHEYLTKVAMEVSDGVFIHPVVGLLKEDDIPAEVRMECYRALLESYYPKERVMLKVYPFEMRYAGPKEAILHAIIRQNFGCSHLIVGRDHAGVGNYYGPFDAQKIFDALSPQDLAIRPLKLDITFWCHKCASMASLKTCPHAPEDRLSISGTKLREMLSSGERPPAEFSRPEVVDILMNYYRSGDKKEVVRGGHS